MSTVSVENIHIRIRDELERLSLSMAEAARRMQEESSQGLRDVCAGRKRASAELIGKLAVIPGLDVLYVLTGRRASWDASQANSAARTTVTPIPVSESNGLTWRQILAIAVDELNAAGKCLPGAKLLELVDLLEQWQAEGAKVDAEKMRKQIRLVA